MVQVALCYVHHVSWGLQSLTANIYDLHDNLKEKKDFQQKLLNFSGNQNLQLKTRISCYVLLV